MTQQDTRLTKEELENMSVEDLLELPLDMVPEAQGFKLPPRAMYHFRVNSLEVGKIGQEDNQVSALILKIGVITTIEMDDPEETPPEDGTEFEFAYPGAKGVSRFKTDAAAILETMPGLTLVETIAALQGYEFVGHVTHFTPRRKKGDDSEPRTYANVRDMVPVGQ